jgi:hypothetical protein
VFLSVLDGYLDDSCLGCFFGSAIGRNEKKKKKKKERGRGRKKKKKKKKKTRGICKKKKKKKKSEFTAGVGFFFPAFGSPNCPHRSCFSSFFEKRRDD